LTAIAFDLPFDLSFDLLDLQSNAATKELIMGAGAVAAAGLLKI